MDKDFAWTLFEKTGSIDAYMLYHDLVDDENIAEDDNQEVLLRADKNRRPGYQGNQHR